MANWNANQGTNIVNADILTRYAVSFALGADILKLGNRTVDKNFSAENMSGDTVYVTLADGGAIYDTDLDLSAGGSKNLVYGDEGATRRQIPVTVGPLTMKYRMSQGDVDLLIKSEEFADKMTARGQEYVTGKAFGKIAAFASAIDCYNATSAADGIIDGFTLAKGGLEASKMGTSLSGVTNVWNRMAIENAFAKKGLNSTINAGDYKFDGATKGFGGLSWATISGDGQNSTFTAAEFEEVTATVSADGTYVTFSAAPITGITAGSRIDTPFKIAGCYVCDALGFPTPTLATFTGVLDASSNTKLYLDHPIINGELKNNALPDPAGWCTIPESGAAVTGALTAGQSYYKPVLVFAKDEFLVGIKGLSPMKGQDSATIPSKFAGDKGIIPWRGTAWSDPEKSDYNFRFDGLWGARILKGCAVKSIYIPAV